MNCSRLLPLRLCHALGLAFACMVTIGCPKNKPTEEKTDSATEKQPLVLLVVDDPKLGDAAAREWQARTEEKLLIRTASISDIEKAARLPADAIIFPTGMIGSLAERGLIAPLDSASLENSDFNYRDIFDQIRLSEMKWGDKSFAAPLGSPQLLLAYRSDILEKAEISPPETWTQYHRAIETLNESGAAGNLEGREGKPSLAAIEPLADGWAGQLLLARAAAYAMHRDQVSPLFRFESMTPLIDQPPYRRALEELVAAAKKGGFAQQRITPQAAMAELCAGRCAMALTWPSPEIADPMNQAAASGIRFAMLPGAVETYRFATKSWEKRGADEGSHVPLLAISGRLAAISATTAEPRRAESLVLWLAGGEVSQQISPHSSATTLFRQSQIATSGRWAASLPAAVSRQYAETLSQTLSLPRSFPGVRLAGRESYLAALDKAVQQALDGKPAGEALAESAQKWTEITTELDVEKQRRANARSLGQGTP